MKTIFGNLPEVAFNMEEQPDKAQPAPAMPIILIKLRLFISHLLLAISFKICRNDCFYWFVSG
jgi:hypothetical protein